MFGAPKNLFVFAILVGLFAQPLAAQHVYSDEGVRPVVGKQPSAHSSHSQTQQKSPGLLGRLMSFGRSDEEPRTRAIPPDENRQPADWTGVPYHEPTSGHGQSATTHPVADPSNLRISSRAGSVFSRSESARRSGSNLGPVPTPPPVGNVNKSEGTRAAVVRETTIGTEPDEFSATYSSRRSGRRDLDPMDVEVLSSSDLEQSKLAGGGIGNRATTIDDEPSVQQRALPTSENPVGDRLAQREPASAGSGANRPMGIPSAAGDASSANKSGGHPALMPPSLAKRNQTSPSPVPAAPETKRPASTLSIPASELAVRKPVQAKPSQDTLTLGPPEGSSPTPAVPGSPSDILQMPVAPDVPELESPSAIGSGVAADTESPKQTKSLPAPQGQWIKNGELPKTAEVVEQRIHSLPVEIPGLRVIAEGPAQIMIRQPTEYVIRVENRGAIAAPGIVVRTSIPDWIIVRNKAASAGQIDTENDAKSSELMWRIAKLAPGATEKLTLQVEANRSGTFGVDVDWTLLPQKHNLMVNVHEPKLEIMIEGPDQVVFGQSETFKVRVLNPGNGVAANVVFTLSPNSATPQTQKVGSIPSGKEAQFEVELTAQDLGELKIHGLATGDLQLRSEQTKTIRVAAAQLEAMLTGPPLRYQNGEATYRLQIRNTGLAASENVAAQLRIPAGVEYLDGLTNAKLAAGMLRWEVGNMAAGESREFTIRCKLNQTGAHLLAFQCQGTAAGKAAVSLTTKVEAIADLVLTINDPPAPAPVSEDVVYELVIHNRGSKAARDVSALTHFSDNIEPARIEGQTGKVSTGQVVFDSIPQINPGQTVKLRIVAQAVKAGLHRFRAEISSGDTVLVAEEATRYLSPADEEISRRSSESVAW